MGARRPPPPRPPCLGAVRGNEGAVVGPRGVARVGAAADLDGGAASLAIAKHLKHGGKHPAEAMRPDDRKEDLRSRLGAPNWPKADLRSRITGVPGPSPTIAKPQGGRGRAGAAELRSSLHFFFIRLIATISPVARCAALKTAPYRPCCTGALSAL